MPGLLLLATLKVAALFNGMFLLLPITFALPPPPPLGAPLVPGFALGTLVAPLAARRPSASTSPTATTAAAPKTRRMVRREVIMLSEKRGLIGPLALREASWASR